MKQTGASAILAVLITSWALLPRPAEAGTARGGNVFAFGDNIYGETTLPPALTNAISVAAGPYHAMALRSDGIVVAWGWNGFGQTNVPVGLQGVVAISAGGAHCLALKSDGTVAAWGAGMPGQTGTGHYGQSVVPSGLANVIAIAAGGNHSLALRSNGTVVAWGDDSSGQIEVPSLLNGVVAIAASGNQSLALTGSGTVVNWGAYAPLPQSQSAPIPVAVPPGLTGVTAISAGVDHSVALLNDGTVFAWGQNSLGQTNTPQSLTGVIALSAGVYDSIALTSAKTLTTWGTGFSEQPPAAIPGPFSSASSGLADPPPAPLVNVSSIAAGADFFLFIADFYIGDDAPQDTQVTAGGSAVMQSSVTSGIVPVNYQWLFNGVPIATATNATLEITNASAVSAGNYSVHVSSQGGSAVSQTAKLAVLPGNDNFTNATQIPGGGGRFYGTTTNATKEPGEPTHAGNAGGHSLWFTWTAPTTATVTMDTVGSAFDTLLAVYTGTELNNLVTIAADDDGADYNGNSLLSFNATSGTTYKIAIDGYNGASGWFILNVTPSVSTSGPAFVAISQFHFLTGGPAQSTIAIQTSTDLQSWSSLASIVVPDAGAIQFTDTQATNRAQRFYRAILTYPAP